MISAFGVDHGHIEKGLKDTADIVRLNVKAGKHGFKLGQAHRKKALSEAGYPTTMKGSIKESFGAGRRGQGGFYRAGQKAAGQAAKKRTQADISDITQGRRPGRGLDPGMGSAMSARFNRSMSKD